MKHEEVPAPVVAQLTPAPALLSAQEAKTEPVKA
jgi:hypothetical protein